jgi:hypothetical protein
MEVILPVYGRTWQVFHAADGAPTTPTFTTGREETGKSLKKDTFMQKVCTKALF